MSSYTYLVVAPTIGIAIVGVPAMLAVVMLLSHAVAVAPPPIVAII